jgi:hypothetical protein
MICFELKEAKGDRGGADPNRRYRPMPVRINTGIRKDSHDGSSGGGTTRGDASSANYNHSTSTALPPETPKRPCRAERTRLSRARFSSSLYLLNIVSLEE